MDDLWRTRLRDDALDLPDPGRPRPGAPAFLGQVTSTGTLAVGTFVKVVPVQLTGTESDGSAGTFTAGSATILALAVGPTAPVTGDEVIVRRVDHRWVFDKQTVGSGGGGPGTAPCLSCFIPSTLTLTWYWCGYNENPCSSPYSGTALGQVWGPTTDTLTYNTTTTKFETGWNISPCWPGDIFATSPPFNTPGFCLYHKFSYNCATATMTLFHADDSIGTRSACTNPNESYGQSPTTPSCSAWAISFGVPSPVVGTSCGGGSLFYGGMLTP